MSGSWRDENHVKIIETEYLTHDVKRIRITKPEGYQFIPGEATDVVINQPEWLGNRHAFTFTSLNDWPFLEFSIKIYKNRNGFTARLDELLPGDDLIIHDSFGNFHYRGEGVFIAGGAGITPFIAILRQLFFDGHIVNNQLFFSNRTEGDIILKEEFEQMLGAKFINILTRERSEKYRFGRIDISYLKEHVKDFSRYFYICGKRKMVEEVRNTLILLGADEEKIIVEMDFSKQVLE